MVACGGGGDRGSGNAGGGSGGGTQSYTVGGTVTGLAGSGLVLQDNGGDDLAVSGGSFTFAKGIASGASYVVTIKTQPSGPSQTCILGGASGTMGSSNITNIALTCTTNAYVIGGAVSGLLGSNLVLQDNGGDDLTVSSNGSFAFANHVASGSVYSVTIRTAPEGPTQGCAVTNGGGTVGAADVATVAVNCGPLTLLAGVPGGQGSIDGVGSAAHFNGPYGIAIDSAGNTYVADTANKTIRKVTAAGVVTTLAGVAGQGGSTDGTASAARFGYPAGLAVDASGNVYVADYANSTIRKITPAGVVSTLAGNAGQAGSTDGIGGAALFSRPYGLTIDAAGNLYITDIAANTIRKVTAAGVVSTLAGTPFVPGSVDGKGGAALFRGPIGITADAVGNLYAVDSGNDTIRKITADGTVSTLAGLVGKAGAVDGGPDVAQFNAPFGITIDSVGNSYVADTSNNTIRKITPAGVVATFAGSAGSSGATDGAGSAALFAHPDFLAFDASGLLYVTDGYNNTIRKITPTGGVSTFVGAPTHVGSSDGSGSQARFNIPYGITSDADGNLYVADAYNSTIRKITPAGLVSTLAGMAGSTGAVDGSGGNARFSYPRGIAVDSSGNAYVTDSSNNEIRKITTNGVVSTLAGSGTIGSASGKGTAASFFYPYGIAVDAAGIVYVADTYNHTIRKITTDGTVSTLAGTAGAMGSTDATGSAASFNHPWGLAIDSAGNLYVADSYNSVIRKITPGAIVTTLAGTAGQNGSNDGIGSAARFSQPTELTVDTAGNVYVSDTGNSTIRRISSSAVVTTVVGTPGAVGIQLGSLPGSINMPYGVTLLPGDPGTLAVADGQENVILRITLPQ